MNRKPPLRVDEDGHKIDIEGIDAPPEAVGRALVKPETRKLKERGREQNTKRDPL